MTISEWFDVAEHDHVRGNPDAPNTVIEYGDFECPYCAAAFPVLRELVDESDGTVRLIFRHFPVPDVHPHALTAALAAEAASSQGKFWEMHDLLFERQSRLTANDLRAYAAELGIDPDLAVGERAQQFGDQVEQSFGSGLDLDVPGTPTLFVNTDIYRGRMDVTNLRAAMPGTSTKGGSLRRFQPWARRKRR